MYRYYLSVLILAGVMACPLPGESAETVPESAIAKIKPSVVNVKKSVAYGLGRDRARRVFATGIIVDAERGIVATNRHVTGTSPAQIFITFLNGEETEAKILHYDAFHDFGFLQYDPAKVDFEAVEAILGSAKTLAEQDPVALIGNNEAYEYTVKFGRVTNLNVSKGVRHTGTFQTSFDRSGGSSGSPVIDPSATVVGIHYAGTMTNSFEMHIDYVVDALEQLRTEGSVRRGDIGVVLDLIHLSSAETHFGLPKTESTAIRELRPGSKRVIFVKRVVPLSPAEEQLIPGDLVLEVNGTRLGDDLYGFDKTIDQHAGEEAALTIFRNGERKILRLPVLDAEKLKVRQFALFAGGVLHNLTPSLRLRHGIWSDGVYLSQASPGSPMAELGRSRGKRAELRSVVIEQVNGIPTPHLDALVGALAPLNSGDEIVVVLRDYGSSQRVSEVEWLTVDLKYSPLRTFDFRADTLDWEETSRTSD